MSDFYNNNWNNDDFQNGQNFKNKEQYFTYNETYLDKKKEKKSKKPFFKFIALIVSSAILGSVITCAAFSMFIPGYIKEYARNNIVSSYSPDKFILNHS